VRSRRNQSKAATVAAVIVRNPRETVAFAAATTAIAFIFANALFWQKGPHPAPIFSTHAIKISTPAATTAPKPVLPPERPHAAAVPAPAHADPIAQLLAPSAQILAVQKVLTAFGYGQIRPTGVLGPETQEAIRRFERSHRMAVTGQVSDALVRALTDMNGRPLQ
jgi:hypothetical protein